MAAPARLHNAIWVKQLADQLRSEGHPVRKLLAEAGIEPRALNSEGARLPFERILMFFDIAAAASGDDCLGLKFGQTRDIRDAGLLAYVGLSSPTMLAALRNLHRYRRVFSDAIELGVDALEETGLLRWEIRAPPVSRARQFVEFSATNLVSALRRTTGRKIMVEHVSFRHARNDSVAAFDRFFGCGVEFGARNMAIKFKTADLHLPMRNADDKLLAVLEEHCRLVLTRHEVTPPSLIEKIERLVIDRLTADQARVEVIALELGMSKRTLARRLADHGTSFNAIVESLRRNLALGYLRDSSMTQIEIAFLLGYTEVSSFHHAFRRWTGKTPGQVRQEKAA